MPEPLLFTKLFIPSPRLKVVLRPRLIGRLNEGFESGRKLTLISAPAGFGKTTLVSEWIAGCGMPVAWLSLDEGDNDLTRFLTYFITALQTLDLSKAEGIKAKIGEGVLSKLQSPQPPPIENILTILLNEITAQPVNLIFILDDYHVIDSNPIDNILAFLIDHLPPQIHLIITSREDPPLPLARLRARDQLTELRAADLRFTPPEAAEFLNQVMGLNLSTEDIVALEKRTEGWIAGLQLAALSMQGQKDASGFVKSFTGSHHFVLDYLLEEVLHRQSESIQTFLLNTSILERMCGSLCDDVLLSPSASGQDTLEYLLHSNLFIVPLDNERRWFRYHHLFGDLLRHRLGKDFPPDEVARYNLRASEWHEKNGNMAEAFHYAIAAGDVSRAARLAELAWQGMDGSFQSAAWLGWVKKIPEKVIRTRLVLCTQIAQSFTDIGDIENSESRLQDAERLLDGSVADIVDLAESNVQFLPGVIAMARANNAQVLGNLDDTIKYAELALQLIPEDDFYRRAAVNVTLEFTHWSIGNLEAVRQAMSDWMKDMKKAGNLTFVVASAFALADILVAQGQIREAGKILHQSLHLAAAQGQDVEPITAHHYLGLAMLSHEMGDDENTNQYLLKAGKLGEQTTLVDWLYRWNLAQAKLRESEGDLESALHLLDEARRVYVRNPIPDVHPIEALKTGIYLKQGNLTKAQSWVRERAFSIDDECTYLQEFEHIMFARVLIAGYLSDHDENEICQAMQLLERILGSAEKQKRAGSVLEILIVQALAHQAHGSIPQALALLQRALTLAEPQGYYRIFVNEGNRMEELLNLIIAQGVKSDYINRLLAAFDLVKKHEITTSSVSDSSSLLEPLSSRELEVLRLIAKGLSNQDICKQLFLAIDTVKGHNRRIFHKLQVQSRTEAIVRANELGLL